MNYYTLKILLIIVCRLVTVVTVFQIPVPLSQKPSPPSRTVTGNIMQLNSAPVVGSAASVNNAVFVQQSACIDIQPLCN